MSNVGEKAKQLGENTPFMKSYIAFQGKQHGWFFSKNPNLEGYAHRPSKVNSYAEYLKLGQNQRVVIIAMANLKHKETRLGEADWKTLRGGYSFWPSGAGAVFWAPEYAWACNIFVGEAHYMAQKNLLSTDKHYFSAKRIWEGKTDNRLKAVEKYKMVTKEKVYQVKMGDVAAFDGTHVEIVTKVENGYFCSRGSGRGDGSDGTLRCGGGPWDAFTSSTIDTNRLIDRENIRFFRYA